MAADLRVHVLYGLDPKWVMKFNEPATSWNDGAWMESYDAVSMTPSVWVGEVSWLKAGLFNDSETYVPDICAEISQLIRYDKLTPVTQELIDKVRALAPENSTEYAVAKVEEIAAFLEEHIGDQAFTVSW